MLHVARLGSSPHINPNPNLHPRPKHGLAAANWACTRLRRVLGMPNGERALERVKARNQRLTNQRA